MFHHFLLFFLICFFIFLFVLNWSFTNTKVIEGLDDTTTTTTTTPTPTPTTSSTSSSSTTQFSDYTGGTSCENAVILSQKNAGNILYLNDQVNTLLPLIQKVSDLNKKYDDLNTQLQTNTQNQITTQTSAGTALNGGSTEPVNITGTD